MNNAELDKKLKSLSVPERSPDYWEEFPGRVMESVVRTPARRHEPEPSWAGLRWAWAGGIAFACLVLGFALGHWHGFAPQKDSVALLENEKMLREVMAMFPNQVRAILQTEKGLQLVLSDEANVPVSSPIWVKIGNGRQSETAVTFSGQEVQIGGEKLTVLSDAKGGVILVGNQFVWSSLDRGAGSRLKIEARPLGQMRL